MSTEQEKDLQAQVRAAIEAWQDKHSLKFRAFKFSAQRNEEYIPAKSEEDENAVAVGD